METTHLEPIWRSRADFIIAADISEGSDREMREQLWARRIDAKSFELCCIPFFVYDLALGDVVETEAKGDRKYLIDRVIERSGRSVFRVWFGESHGNQSSVVSAVVQMGALIERSSIHLIAVDASDQEVALQIADYLTTAQDKGDLMYEIGRMG